MFTLFSIPHDSHYHRKAPHSILALPNGEVLIAMGGANRLPKDKLLLFRLENDGTIWEQIHEFTESQGPAGLYWAEGKVKLTSSVRNLPDTPDYYTVLTVQNQASSGNGRHWNTPIRIDTGHQWNHHGWPIIRMRDNTLVLPYHFTLQDLSEGTSNEQRRDAETVCSLLLSTDEGNMWRPAEGYVRLPGGRPCEPTIVELSNGHLFMLIRTTLGKLYQTQTGDKGRTWAEPAASDLVSPFVCAHLFRLSFDPSKIVVAWNNSPENRRPLDIAISYDECGSWQHTRTLSNPGYTACYPKITRTPDGKIAVTWREYNDIWTYIDAKAALLDEEWIQTGS